MPGADSSALSRTTCCEKPPDGFACSRWWWRLYGLWASRSITSLSRRQFAEPLAA
jgi:hypothetical protein